MADWVVRAALLALLPCLLLLSTVFLGNRPRSDSLTREHTASRQTSRPSHHERVVLVTGAAGFVGFHVAQEVVEGWGASVVGLDNFNDYYDVQLKKDRAAVLVGEGVRMYRGDLCDLSLLRFLFAKFNFTDVVHMAAQAGVRHSLADPLAYVHSNIECFLTLLETLREHRHAVLVYASSSSVYGQGAPLPFSPLSPPHPPSNMYAALKTANEHFASAYCSQYGVRATGLRLFTVYGPWGRPDMAVYRFAESIASGRPVPLFEASPTHPILRDFTYINDTVGGVLAALDHTPCHCGEVYNLGYGKPVAIATMLEYLQEELQQKAVIRRSSLPPSDLRSTCADISDSRRVLNFHPRVTLKEGIHLFVLWFKSYLADRREWESSGSSEDRNHRLELALLAREGEGVGEESTEYRKRIAQLKERYIAHATEAGTPLPNLEKRGFVHYPGVDSPGSTVIKGTGYHGNIELMEKRCLATEQCVAFTERGEFKNHLRPQAEWSNSSDGLGIFVADMDVCAADLHHCDGHAQCKSTGPGVYACVCEEGYVRLGRVCVERYGEGMEGESEGVWRLSDQLEGVDWEGVVGGHTFVFFQGLDSPGGDYLVVEEGGGDTERLEEACRHTHRCIGFNSNGILKHSLRPPPQWVHWTNHPGHGLHVLDVDYCSLSVEQCPPHSHCTRHHPGNYSCVCDPGWRRGRGEECERGGEEEPSLVHVILSVDHAHFPGVATAVHSLLHHTPTPERVRVHVVMAGGGRGRELEEFLHCFGLLSDRVEVVVLEEGWLGGLVRVTTGEGEVGNLASEANFARFAFHSLFPLLHRAIYIDTDTVVQGDVAELWEQVVASDQLLVAAPRQSPSYGQTFGPRVRELFQRRYGRIFADSDPTFNAGVYGVNFDLWRERDIHSEVLFWMRQHAQESLWQLGTQPIMLLVAHGQWEWLDPRWNVNGLGWNGGLKEQWLREAKLLHWSGRRKPWLPDGLYHHLWQPHSPVACGGRGQCVRREGGGYLCQCEDGNSGELCQDSR